MPKGQHAKSAPRNSRGQFVRKEVYERLNPGFWNPCAEITVGEPMTTGLRSSFPQDAEFADHDDMPHLAVSMLPQVPTDHLIMRPTMEIPRRDPNATDTFHWVADGGIAGRSHGLKSKLHRFWWNFWGGKPWWVTLRIGVAIAIGLSAGILMSIYMGR